MKKKTFNENAAIRGAIRRTFSRSPVVREVLQKVRREVPRYKKDGARSSKDAVQYQCNVCKEWVGSTKVAVDHIVPVIDVDKGFTDWNDFVARLFCSEENLQVVCDICHQQKTNAERFERMLVKDQEMIALMEKGKPSPAELKKNLQKFTPKKLAAYPKEFAERVMKLKALIKKDRKNG